MYYRLTEYDTGDYVGDDGKRYRLAECNQASTPDGINVGYTEFNSKEECMTAWNITYSPAPPPERDETFTI